MRAAIFDDKGKPISNSVGQSAETIAEMAGFSVPKGTRAIVVQPVGTGLVDPLGGEKMCPVIAAYGYSTLEEGVDIARQNLEKDGKGHSVSFHSDSETNIEYVGSSLCVSLSLIHI